MRARPVRLLTAAAFAVPATFGVLALAGTAGADSSSVSSSVAVEGAAASPVTTLPTSNIKQTTLGYRFRPAKLTITSWSSTTVQTCTAKLARAKIVNKTTVSQTVTSKFGNTTMPAGSSVFVCFYGSGTHTFTYHLSGTTASLRMAVS